MYVSQVAQSSLKKLGLDVDGAVQHAYRAIRNDALTIGRPADQVMARSSFCNEIAPRVAVVLARQLRQDRSQASRELLGVASLQAFIEFHDTDCEALDLDHAFALLGDQDPDQDIIVDATYQQFLVPEVQRNLPLVFVGSRGEAQTLMEECAVNPSACLYYQQATLNQPLTRSMAAEFGLTHPRL